MVYCPTYSLDGNRMMVDVGAEVSGEVSGEEAEEVAGEVAADVDTVVAGGVTDVGGITGVTVSRTASIHSHSWKAVLQHACFRAPTQGLR